MIGVTERAKEELKRKLSAKVDNPEASLRLTASGPDKFSLDTDVEVPDDQVVKHKGSKVLLVEKELANSLEGHTLAFEDKKLVIVKGPLSGFNKKEVKYANSD